MHNIVLSNSSDLTMTSREIADLVNSRHDKVKQSIERLATPKKENEKPIICLPPMGEYLDSLGRKATQYIFTGQQGKRDSLIVVAQLCPEFTAAIVDRWQELEAKQSAPALNPANLSRLQLIEMAMQAEQERLVLEEKVEKIQPMADALIRIAHSEGGVCLTTAAKVLQQKPKSFIASLAARAWIYRRPGNGAWHGYQTVINKGYIEQKVQTVERPDGSDKSVSQCLVTPKGIAKLAVIFGVESIQPDLIGGV